MTATILRGDARALPLADASVDLIVTSPPYWALRSYQDGGEHYAGQIGAESSPAAYVDALLSCTREWVRVLKPTGSMFVVLGDKYATHAGPTSGTRLARGSFGTLPARHAAQRRDAARAGAATDVREKSRLMLPERYRLGAVLELGLIARAVIVWSKPACMPESVTDRVRTMHEDIVHLTKAGRYFANLDAIRTPLKAPNRTAGKTSFAARDGEHARTATGAYTGPNPLGALPGSVWEVATEPLRVPDHIGVQHYAAYPTKLVRRIVEGWSPPTGVVLDPFGGSGTTALAASVLGRHGISIDASADYCRLAEWRTTDPGERARVIGAPKPPAEAAGQGGLFELTEVTP